MPESILGGHASFPAHSQARTAPVQQTRTSPEAHMFAGDAASTPPRDNTLGRKSQRKIDKRSPEYVLKSGLAGGLAGCAVSRGVFYVRI
jgi:solute carrier family 25 (mitochondrial carrier protein), member 16